MKKLLMAAMFIATLAFTIAVDVAYAVSQPVEWMHNPNSWRYSLDYLGMGYAECDTFDYGFRLIKTFSADPERYRIYSFNSRVAGVFHGKSPLGHQLETTLDAYICIGFKDTWNAGGPENVESYLFVWVQ